MSDEEQRRQGELMRTYVNARDCRFLEAYWRARSARFEHGETPERFE
jgi:hypothetical protein